MTTSNILNFETALNELETIVEKISAQELNLEQALHSFEKGVSLARQCQKLLKEAEQKVQLLIDYEEGKMQPLLEDK